MRVLVLESGESWRTLGLAKALDGAPGITTVLERELADQTWSSASPTVILVSEESARNDARRSPASIRTRYPSTRILVHGDGSDPELVAQLIADGADGYFTLEQGEEKLLKAIDVVRRGGVWSSEAVVSAMAQRLRGEHEAAALSAPEQTLLEMLYEGLTNKEMAQRLELAEITVKSRLARLCRRFGVRTRVQLLSVAIRRDLIRRHG